MAALEIGAELQAAVVLPESCQGTLYVVPAVVCRPASCRKRVHQLYQLLFEFRNFACHVRSPSQMPGTGPLIVEPSIQHEMLCHRSRVRNTKIPQPRNQDLRSSLHVR